MPREFEAKAHVDEKDFDKIILVLNNEYGHGEKVEKSDCYYLSKDRDEFRIRCSNGKIIYTTKIKQIDKNGFESNIESEKEISKDDVKVLTEGLEPFFKKNKKGFVWKTNFLGEKANIELFDVEKCGYFLEIEVLFGENILEDDKRIKEAKEWITGIFKKFNIEDKIEKRKYMEMIGYER